MHNMYVKMGGGGRRQLNFHLEPTLWLKPNKKIDNRRKMTREKFDNCEKNDAGDCSHGMMC